MLVCAPLGGRHLHCQCGAADQPAHWSWLACISNVACDTRSPRKGLPAPPGSTREALLRAPRGTDEDSFFPVAGRCAPLMGSATGKSHLRGGKPQRRGLSPRRRQRETGLSSSFLLRRPDRYRDSAAPRHRAAAHVSSACRRDRGPVELHFRYATANKPAGWEISGIPSSSRPAGSAGAETPAISETVCHGDARASQCARDEGQSQSPSGRRGRLCGTQNPLIRIEISAPPPRRGGAHRDLLSGHVSFLTQFRKSRGAMAERRLSGGGCADSLSRSTGLCSTTELNRDSYLP